MCLTSLRVCEIQPFLFLGKLAMVTKHILSLYMCVHSCHLLLVHRHLCHTGWRPEPRRKPGLGRAEMGARQGIGAGKGTVAQQGCLGVQGDLTLPSPAPWFCLEAWLNPGGICFPSACSLRAGFPGFSPGCSQVTPVAPGQPPAFVHTPSKSFPVKRGPNYATSHSGSETPSTAAASPQAI